MAATKAFIFMRMETTGGKKTAVVNDNDVNNVNVAGVVLILVLRQRSSAQVMQYA